MIIDPICSECESKNQMFVKKVMGEATDVQGNHKRPTMYNEFKCRKCGHISYVEDGICFPSWSPGAR